MNAFISHFISEMKTLLSLRVGCNILQLGVESGRVKVEFSLNERERQSSRQQID